MDKVKNVVSILLRQLNLSEWELSIGFVDPAEIHRLNLEFRNIDRSTDVLSFPQQHWIQPLGIGVEEPLDLIKADVGEVMKVLGDIVISVADAQNNARDIGQDLDREIAFLLTHGLLHLCGHDHQETEEEKIMMELQKSMVGFLSESSKVPEWNGCVVPIANERRPLC